MRTRSRRQRLAAGAVLATTSLLGTYLVALRPQPTYAAPRGGGVESAGQAAPKLGNFSTSPSIPTCAQADVTVQTPEGLRDAILASQDGYVVCIDGTIELTANLPTIDDTTITFVGDDPTQDVIDGKNSFRIIYANLEAFFVPADTDTVTVANIGLVDGASLKGSAISIRSYDDSLVVVNSTFTSNHANRMGGAVYAFTTHTDISGSSFADNSANGAGGALYLYHGDASIADTSFVENVVDSNNTGYTFARGGAVFSYGTDVHVSQVSFVSNRVLSNGALSGTSSGGAIYADDGDVMLSNTFLGSNYAGTSGGTMALNRVNLGLNFSTSYDDSVGTPGQAHSTYLRYGSTLTSIASVVGSRTDDTMITFNPANSSVDDSYSVSTGPQVFTDPTSRTEPAGSLQLGAIDGTEPGQPGRTPAETSVLVTAAPTTNPTSHLPQPVTVDQLGNPRPTNPGGPFWIGARQAPFVPPNPNPPVPTPAVAPSAPRKVTAEPLDGAAKVSWEPPALTGSFPLTYYLVKGRPGSAACLVKSPETECVIDGLTNGQTYFFTVEALNGAGWGAASEPSPAVTPRKPAVSLVLDSGPRVADGRRDRIQATGAALGVPAGAILTPFIRYAGESTFRQGRAAIAVQSDGSFAWSRKVQSSRGVTAYVMWKNTESNQVTWTRVR
jgi:hypothetical protein